MVLKKMARLSCILAPLTGLALVGYICYLVLAHYKADVAVQEAELRHLASENGKVATAIAYFLAQQKEELKNLAQCPELTARLEKDTGLPAELQHTTVMLNELLDMTHQAENATAAPAFERIMVIDKSGAVLADTMKEPEKGDAEGWKRSQSPRTRTATVTALRSGHDLKLLVSAPYFYRGAYAGQVLGRISSHRIYRQLTRPQGNVHRYPIALVYQRHYAAVPPNVREMQANLPASIPAGIEPLVPYPMAGPEGSESPHSYAILVPVEETPISFMTFVPASELHVARSPQLLLYTSAAVAIIMLGGMIYFQRVNLNNLLLQAHLEETRLREAAVDETNRLLAAEIDERCQTERALRETEARFRAIVGAVPVTIYVYRHCEGRPSFTFLSDKVLELTGVPAEAAIEDAKVLFDLVHPEDIRGLFTAIDASVAVGQGFSHECRIVKPNGETRWVLANAVAKQESEGADRVWYGCIEDITVRKEADLELRESRRELLDTIAERTRAERLVRESEATLRSLIDAMPAGVWWFNEEGKVEYLNGRFVELFGFGIGEAVTVEDWFSRCYPDPEQRRAALQARETAVAEARRDGTQVPPQETRVVCRDGSVRHIIVNTQFCQGHTLEIFTDITQQEFIDNELLKVQKMESLGVLAGGIAHDFNNILTGIMGNISFARMFLEREHKSQKPLKAAEQASRRAAELAGQLLTFAKGGQPIKTVVDVGELVAESLSLSLRGSNVQARLEMAADVGRIEADAGQVHQAFGNIIINAMHAMPAGGTLTVTGKSVTISGGNKLSLLPGPYVKLGFSDQGGGIDAATMKKIFDPYFTTKAGGNGLGLASTLSIVRRHGGHIQVESRLGSGTTFTVYLPATKESEAPGPAKGTTTPGAPDGARVLVMDDEEMLRELTSGILKHLGYQVTTCADGREAVSLYRDAQYGGSRYSAVIMDLTVPGGMGGMEAAKQILSCDPDAKLIVSSGYSNDKALSEYRSYGFRGAVLKPYQASDLAQTLAGLLHTA